MPVYLGVASWEITTETLNALQLRGHRRSTKPEQEAWFPTGRMLASLTSLSNQEVGEPRWLRREAGGTTWSPGQSRSFCLLWKRKTFCLATCYSNLHLCNVTEILELPNHFHFVYKKENKSWKNGSPSRGSSLTKTDACSHQPPRCESLRTRGPSFAGSRASKRSWNMQAVLSLCKDMALVFLQSL